MRRKILTLHTGMEVTAFVSILNAVADVFPDAIVASTPEGWVLWTGGIDVDGWAAGRGCTACGLGLAECQTTESGCCSECRASHRTTHDTEYQREEHP